MTETKRIDLALEKMKEHGFKYTKRREMLLTFLAEADKYTSAKEVYEYMSQQFSGISYDTIYRNLKDFSDMHLLEETEWDGEKKFRFHCDHHEMGHHHHFICTNCGATREIHMCPMDYFKEQLAGCKIEGHRFEIFGKCENCIQA
ncbi:Fur family transcriptional regulator [uncultured Vagococcus sp.]|uniref:Fur family transcriptional regulator n=1 Tax=uncultured Vagococcus sp. TaxID=189676 RepID=UPI0028D5E05A|nr:Fur family transcriptional regulator [uncultured Vagococcus sp.]